MKAAALSCLLLTLFSAPAHAQANAADTQVMQALTAAQAAARRPGDESLGCEALEAETRSIAGTPALRSFLSQSAAQGRQGSQQAAEMMSVLPHLARSQRVIGLARARNCPWLQGAGAPR
ncbi:MAG TPA: hypothetical protein VG873_09630 [Burkholderiales bacterium]|jgi:hypothetical protein|nr:hypothetical protein [Burkholderiales bacterium]